MRLRIPALLFLLIAHVAHAQKVVPLVAPAERILKFRAALRLDTAQMEKLHDLARDQNEALARATSAFLHAEADLVDAGRSNDQGTRRSAMEKRSKAAIDAEMVRLRTEKDARGVLNARQITLLDILMTETDDASARTRPLWESQVAPLPLAAVPFAVADSETVRIAVEPLTSEIFIDNQSVGFGRVAVRLPVGSHMLKFRSPSCIDTKPIAVAKGDRNPVAHRMSCAR
jgi:hypothetical protein